MIIDLLVDKYIYFFQDIFGKITPENRYAQPCFMIPLASIFGVNYSIIIDNFESSKIRFQNLIQDPEILDMLAIGGKARQLLHAIRERQIRILNKKIKDTELFE